MKYIPYGRQTIDKDDICEVVKVLESDWITQGPKVEDFEIALARYCRAKYAVVVSSGTAALQLACLAAGLKKSDEVITSPITFVATSNAILCTGARPVFADVEYDTANIDPDDIVRKINRKTKAILPIHIAGLPSDMPRIRALAQENNLLVIEDACHALGAEYKSGKRWFKIGSCSHSDMSVFSFHPVKSITTGEGGAITTNDRKLYDRLVILRNHGIVRDKAKFLNPYSLPIGDSAWYYESQFLSFNYRITDFQCALGISQLRKINSFIARRKEIAAMYRRVLSSVDEIELPVQTKNAMSSWHLFYIRLKNKNGAKNMMSERNSLFSYLRENKIQVQLHYIPVYLHPFYRSLGYKKGLCRRAEDFFHRTISIPIFPALKNKDIKFIVNKIKKYFHNS